MIRRLGAHSTPSYRQTSGSYHASRTNRRIDTKPDPSQRTIAAAYRVCKGMEPALPRRCCAAVSMGQRIAINLAAILIIASVPVSHWAFDFKTDAIDMFFPTLSTDWIDVVEGQIISPPIPVDRVSSCHCHGTKCHWHYDDFCGWRWVFVRLKTYEFRVRLPEFCTAEHLCSNDASFKYR